MISERTELELLKTWSRSLEMMGGVERDVEFTLDSNRERRYVVEFPDAYSYRTFQANLIEKIYTHGR